MVISRGLSPSTTSAPTCIRGPLIALCKLKPCNQDLKHAGCTSQALLPYVCACLVMNVDVCAVGLSWHAGHNAVPLVSRNSRGHLIGGLNCRHELCAIGGSQQCSDDNVHSRLEINWCCAIHHHEDQLQDPYFVTVFLAY